MKRSVLISLIPAVLGCANIKSNPCAMAVASNVSGCADVNDASSVPEWAAGCSMNSLIKECKCQYTAGGDAEAPAPAPAATTLATRVASAAPKATAEEPAKSAPVDTGAVAGSCSAAKIDELVGYGYGTTGGSGAPVVVKSCSELKSALDKGGVIHIDGMLDGCDLMKVPSDTTVLGVGSNSGLTNGGFRIVKSNNVIIRNLVLRNPPKEMDCIDIETSTYVWIDHNDFATEGIDGTDKDYFDGLLDAKRASDFLTFSWNKFADHWKASLIGHSDDNGSQDEGKLHVTYHHNYWSNINSRAPSIRFGTAHIYSSCYEDLPTSGVNSRMGAKVLVESTAFKNVRRPIITNLDSREDGFAVERNNLFENSETAITQEKDFTPPYEYTTSSADCVCELVKSKAGTGVISI